MKEKRDLEVKLAAASHDATKLRSDVAVLEQQLAAKAVECTALRAELKDNLHRWEQESLQRMEAEQQLQSTKEEMKAAVPEGKKATKEASLKGRAHETAMRELISCRTRHRSLQSAKVRRGLCHAFVLPDVLFRPVQQPPLLLTLALRRLLWNLKIPALQLYYHQLGGCRVTNSQTSLGRQPSDLWPTRIDRILLQRMTEQTQECPQQIVSARRSKQAQTVH